MHFPDFGINQNLIECRHLPDHYFLIHQNIFDFYHCTLFLNTHHLNTHHLNAHLLNINHLRNHNQNNYYLNRILYFVVDFHHQLQMIDELLKCHKYHFDDFLLLLQ